MLYLSSTAHKVQVITSSAADVRVHASVSSLETAPFVVAPVNVAISSATTTDIVVGHASGKNVRTLLIRNNDAALTCIVTVVLTDGTTAVPLQAATLGPGGVLHYTESSGFNYQASILRPDTPYAGKLIGTLTDADPNHTLFEMQRGGNVAATPTNIGTSVARCCLFHAPTDIVVNRIRFYGVGATTSVYRCAIYRYSDLARLTAELPFTTVASTWGSVDAGGITIVGGELYFMAVTVNATGTVAGVACIGTTVAATTGQIATAPSSLPGNLAAGAGYIDNYMFQFAVTAGALPNPAASPVAQAAWTGGFPAFLLDNNSTA